jgi:DNA-binding NtrC family response regulator
MLNLPAAAELYAEGRFLEALRLVDEAQTVRDHRESAQVLRSELLLALGRLGEARALATTLLKSNQLLPAHRSGCEYVLGRIAREDGKIDLAIEHFQRAASRATEAKDLKRLCLAQIGKMLLVSDRNGPAASSPLLQEVRATVTRLGDPRITAQLHVFFGEMEGRRGLLRSAYRHASIAINLLRTSPNYWLESVAENLLLAIALLRSDFPEALKHGRRALDLAELSGSAGMCRASLGNLGNTFYSLGDFDQAMEYFHRATRSLPCDGEVKDASLENIARVYLRQGNLARCAELLDEIESSVKTANDRTLFTYRYTELTRSWLCVTKGLYDEAIARANSALEVADVVRDDFLKTKALLMKAEFLQSVGRRGEFRAAFESAVSRFDGECPELYVQYERILARAALDENALAAAVCHYERAKRMCRALHDVPAELDLASCADAIATHRQNEIKSGHQRQGSKLPEAAVHCVSAMLMNAARPEAVATEVLALLNLCDCVEAACLISRSSRGSEPFDEVIIESTAEFDPAAIFSDASECRLAIGSTSDRAFELRIKPKPDSESAATVKAIQLLLSTMHELQHARVAREERATLWPANESLTVQGDAVITGHMRELMTLVERVASVNISVLIFGESGTGKEIIARAIHDYSDRAKNAFVPLNCAAVPRELMESQLFGHRRGAFTGADRDFAGFIRAADNGTLFLDEIAELSLDLQPKLLRFLESGEIAPIGEPAPLHVNVRVLAATNKNLEELVREGKFREDLFYRLNVVPLTIRPLRERRDEIPALVQHLVDRAAVQFKKGHLTVAEETMERLLLYRWPGNVRQLQHELQRIVALAEPNSTILPEAISAEILGALPLLRPAPPVREMAVSLNEKLPSTIARIECEMIKIALRDSHGKVDAAAKALGISRKGLYLKRQRLGL